MRSLTTVAAGLLLAYGTLGTGTAYAAEPCGDNLANVVHYSVATAPPVVEVCLEVAGTQVDTWVYLTRTPNGVTLDAGTCVTAPLPCGFVAADPAVTVALQPLHVTYADTDWACGIAVLPVGFCVVVGSDVDIHTEAVGSGGALVVSGATYACAAFFCYVPGGQTVTIPLPPPIT
jgi:hypothetical protein